MISRRKTKSLISSIVTEPHSRSCQLEAVSKPLEQDEDAGELEEAQEVVGVEFVANYKAAEVVEPGTPALDGPAPFVAT